MLNLQSIYFGQNHPEFDYKDYGIVKKVQRLALKHHRQAENDCNGEGWVKGKFYRCDGSVEGTYLNDGETTIFDWEMGELENKINDLITIHNRLKYQTSEKPFKVEFQGDPRGATVKLYYDGEYIGL
jgi:hypothetical protein